MKLANTIGKNLKLLFRNKESAYTIIFGPILIILIVSFAFLGSDDVQIDLGVYPGDNSELATKTIETLNQQYTVNVYPAIEDCIDGVKTGNTHACIVFEPMEGDVSPVTFHLDFSRIDLVYQVVDDLSTELDIQADVIREQLATNALLRMQTSADLVEEAIVMTQEADAAFAITLEALGKAETGLVSIPNQTLNITDINPLSGFHLGLAANAQHIADESALVFDEAIDVINDLEDECDECPESLVLAISDVKQSVDEAEEEIGSILSETQEQQLEDAQLILRLAIDDIEALEGTITNATSAGITVTTGVSDASVALEDSVNELKKVEQRLLYTADFLRGQETSPDTLSAPVQIRTENIGSADNAVSFAYPYLLVLVIMFIGMLLASMLIVTDKSSRARFRNFTTPTSDLYHVLVSFLTAFCILLLEVLVILMISAAFIATPLFTHFGSTLLLIIIAIIMFTFVGMIIGYLSTTQEAAMITSISVGSVLLFVSNLVFPVEGMTSVVQFLSSFNPYIVLSELIRKNLVYGVTASQATGELLVLLVTILLLILFTVFVQRRIKKAYFRQEEPLLPPKHVPSPLHLGARLIYNEVELMDVLDRMTRDEFTRLIPHRENVISIWAAKELRNKRLSRQLRTTSKEKMILKLDKYLKRHGKHIKR